MNNNPVKVYEQQLHVSEQLSYLRKAIHGATKHDFTLTIVL